MAGLLHNIIVRAEVDASDHTVRIGWQNGSVTLADFQPLLGQGVFTALRDPVFFQGAEIVDGGHALAWPGELEFDADALWFEAHPEDSPETLMIHRVSLPS